MESTSTEHSELKAKTWNESTSQVAVLLASSGLQDDRWACGTWDRAAGSSS